ncbi:Aste57867_9003 [Aphanomyces stellatus]|uniref:Aste57867_9003 protein n=1 Tax=Aphanomyces stellatus TaxID=120398 RepID=A0A485KLW2_9STRA|nr:hypothetical protein As57867_008968 [Aphanomyces stellatus]VFT85887.1 Aste57867_9003 [Aphanomyces stellatus]
MGLPSSTLHDYFKRGVFAKYSSNAKPLLTPANQATRLKWALDFVHNVDGELVFDDLMDYVHVDEKWFFMTRVKKTYYLTPGEKAPHLTCKSKRYIKKAMFLFAVARPRWYPTRNCWFDGKIGTWHFTKIVPAKRTSRNRPAGHPVMEPVSVTRDVYRHRRQGHSSDPRKMAIYTYNDQDSARQCWCPTPRFLLLPPNSPDLNVLDLGFFRVIQSLQAAHHAMTVEDIVSATLAAWNAVESSTLGRNFTTLQSCCQEIIRAGGNNNFKIPHLGKSKLMAHGKPGDVLLCDRSVWADGCAMLGSLDFNSLMRTLQVEVRQNLDFIELCSMMEDLDIKESDDDGLTLDVVDILQVEVNSE